MATATTRAATATARSATATSTIKHNSTDSNAQQQNVNSAKRKAQSADVRSRMCLRSVDQSGKQALTVHFRICMGVLSRVKD